MYKVLMILGLLLLPGPARAQIESQAGRWEIPTIVSRAAVVMDAETGTVIYSKNPDMEIPPASLTKLMTMHLGFKEIYEGRASLDEMIEPTSESWAVNQLPLSSLMHLGPAQKLSLRELFLGLSIFSGNDASAAVALRFAPTVEDFVEMMNVESRALGLSRTRFADASGYSEHNMTTAREFAEFTRIYLREHPQSLAEFHSISEFTYPKFENWLGPFDENSIIRTQRNRNTLVGRVEGVDGLKTGSIPAAGFNIALTAERLGTRFIAIILGAPAGWGGDRIRDLDGERLLDWAFDNYHTIRLRLDAPGPVRVWKGSRSSISTAWGAPLEFTALLERGAGLSWHIETERTIIAPLPAGSRVGNLLIYDSLGELRRIPLITTAEVQRGNFFKRFIDSIRLFFR
ncbi:MAG: D-alanyl-D-alanine carboxypeptidase [Treponema sp.]|nr:D-alanyl-D-alanine carboxypeptidase [Treponema sp.]